MGLFDWKSPKPTGRLFMWGTWEDISPPSADETDRALKAQIDSVETRLARKSAMYEATMPASVTGCEKAAEEERANVIKAALDILNIVPPSDHRLDGITGNCLDCGATREALDDNIVKRDTCIPDGVIRMPYTFSLPTPFDATMPGQMPLQQLLHPHPIQPTQIYNQIYNPPTALHSYYWYESNDLKTEY